MGVDRRRFDREAIDHCRVANDMLICNDRQLGLSGEPSEAYAARLTARSAPSWP